MCFEGTFLPGFRRGLLFGSALLLVSAAWAADPLAGAGAATNSIANSPLTAPVGPSLLGPLVRMLGALALVVGLLFAAQWFLRQQRRFGTPKGMAHLNVLEVKSLGNRHALYVIGYERQRLLLASSPTGLSLISALPDAPADGTGAEPAVPVVSFTDALMQAVGRR
jgi:flagellar biogenesis protein FliO